MGISIEGKKILVLSVPSWNSKIGSNTWQMLLEKYDSNNIANIALREEVPDSKVCNHYFVISENRVIKSIFRRKIKTGYRISTQQSEEQVSEDLAIHNARYKKMSTKRSYFKLLMREIIWKIGRWKSAELNAFIEEFRPDIVLFAMEGYIHLNRISRYVLKKTGAKSVGYFWDDNFTYKQQIGLGFYLYRFFQRKSLKKLAKKTNAFWAITNTTKREADKIFNINCKVLTKPLRETTKPLEILNKPIHILYTGNLFIGRDVSLIKIVQALKEINKEDIHFCIDVYTKTNLTRNAQKELQCSFCKIHEPIPQEEVFNLQSKADILLFLEGIDGKFAKTARLSFSTKITDYLAAGKCIFAIGNRETAPIEYLRENDAAIVVSEYTQIKSVLLDLLNNKEKILTYGKKALECGLKNHNEKEIKRTFEETLIKVLREDTIED